ncbi:FecCD family ABC transporter permease [Paenibacillus apiarius]|uniref:Iron ABC transporter permease n=1 Tax=Paenibacillus apiarius TaxID=46240 RepID=A0ABT4E1E5_9BACL|nr:iron ABC transporter permease [Paenibacillus apiarius]MCY9517607.1 iron ABC transporter permease [Paenibacillus apiarius]MCY9522133.1 iron ABC transporter permease [Paenibacillus apiarius]MCY9552578.1 iron ABC transporter permease [Paenibacillus apiarius]MCY9559227.1 iron ABC transporter permease [Paenibacillus apiarius]MCY9683650.1 iron ABC transporter permease [Paenibacillus apiarius]
MLNPRTAKHTFMFIAFTFIVAALSLLSLSVGGVGVPLKEVLASLAGRNAEASNLIIMQFRLPRIAAAILIGAALAAAGALLQGVIRNPLASPDLLGVTGGASVAVVAFMTFVTGYSIHWVPFIAIGGALVATTINYVFAWKKGVSPFRLVLIGIGISTAMGALTTFLLISGPAYLAAQVLNWMTGSIYGTNWSYIEMLWPWVAVFIPLSLLLAKELNVQSLGEDVARGLGSRLQLSRMILLFYSVALAGAAVGVAGTISFIGLMAPHIARRLVGNSYKMIIPVSAFIGAIILLLADLAGRMLFQPLDIPAGVFTAGIGAPFFMYLLFKRKKT